MLMKSPLLHLFPSTTVEPKKQLSAFLAKPEGMVSKAWLRPQNPLLPSSLIIYLLYKYRGYQVYLIQTHRHWGRVALFLNTSPSLYMEVIHILLFDHFSIDFYSI